LTNETLPLEPFATTAVTTESFTTVKDAACDAPKLTEETPVKEFPLIVIVSPVPAVTGLNEVITG
jgi:hypothetical protein